MCLLPLSYSNHFHLRISAGSWGSYCLGMGVAGLSFLSPMHTPPIVDFWMERKNALFTHADFYSSPRVAKWGRLAIRILPIAVHPHAQVLGVFGLTQTFIFIFTPRVAKHPWTAIRVLPVACSSMDKNRAAFPHAGPPLSVPFFAGSDCLPTHWYSSIWGAHGELRAVLLHPWPTVKGHSRFWLSHRLFGSFFPAVSCAHW